MATDSLSLTFSALADPTRRAILDRLADGPRTVRQLAEPFAISGPAISRHLKVLSRAGLVVQGRRAQWRPCRLDATPLKEVLTYAETYRQVWEGNLDNLEAYLKELKEPQQPAAAHRGRRKRR